MPRSLDRRLRLLEASKQSPIKSEWELQIEAERIAAESFRPGAQRHDSTPGLIAAIEDLEAKAAKECRPAEAERLRARAQSRRRFLKRVQECSARSGVNGQPEPAR